MNVYDFDGTIYDGDSSVDFWLYSIRKKPSVFLKCLPELFCGALLYGLKRIPKEKWKEHFFSFLRYLPADDTRVTRFWEQHTGKIKKWYLDQKQENSEKVRRFRREYPDAFIDEFYTDSKKDLPLASIAGKAYFVRKNTIREMKTE